MKASSAPRIKYRCVEFFKKSDGTKPVAEWLKGLDDERAIAVATGIRFFEEYPEPVVPKKFFEKVSPHIWEIKTHYGKQQFRVLAFPDGDTIIVAVLGLAKKSTKLSQDEIDVAEDRWKEHMARKRSRQR